MTVVCCPELNYLEAKRRKGARPWLSWEDKILRDYAGVDPAILVSMFRGRNRRVIMARQRELGLRP